MRAFRLVWMAFSGFFAWVACAPLMPVMQDGFHPGATQQSPLSLDALLTACVFCTAAVRLAPSTPVRRGLPHSNITA